MSEVRHPEKVFRVSNPIPKKPSWMRVKAPTSKFFKSTDKILRNKNTSFYPIIKVIGGLLILQVVLGIFTLLFGAQIVIASMHQISSIFLVSSCIYFLFLNKNTNLQP